jgi:ABC-type antimicrobial peptide transport system permease subunit
MRRLYEDLRYSSAFFGAVVGVSPGDPVTIAGSALFLGAIAMLASYLLARRATKVDPMVVLRDR